MTVTANNVTTQTDTIVPKRREKFERITTSPQKMCMLADPAFLYYGIYDVKVNLWKRPLGLAMVRYTKYIYETLRFCRFALVYFAFLRPC